MWRFIFASSANTEPQMSQILLLKHPIHCTDFFPLHQFFLTHQFFSLHQFVLHCTDFFFTAPIFSVQLSCIGQRRGLAGRGFPLRKECGMSNIKFSNLPPRPFMKGSFLSPNSKYERTTWCWKTIKIIVGWPTPLLSCTPAQEVGHHVPHLWKRSFYNKISSANQIIIDKGSWY